MKTASPALKFCEYTECQQRIVKRYREGEKKFQGRKFCRDECYKAFQRNGKPPGARFKRCFVCTKLMARTRKMSSKEWAEKKYCSRECHFADQGKGDPPILAGPFVDYDIDSPPPCFLDSEFFAEEGRIKATLSKPGPRREGVLAPLMENVRDIWCLDCPILFQCAAWGVESKYTGIAGGSWLIDGVAQ